MTLQFGVLNNRKENIWRKYAPIFVYDSGTWDKTTNLRYLQADSHYNKLHAAIKHHQRPTLAY